MMLVEQVWLQPTALRYDGTLNLPDSGWFSLFSWILSAPPSHKTFLLTGSSTSTLPPSSISSPHFSSLWVLVYWISGICFPGPVSVGRGISHWRTALIYTPLRLAQQKIKLSKKFPIYPPSPPSTRIFTSSLLLLPCALCIIKLADVIHTLGPLRSLHSCVETPTLCQRQMVRWWDNQSNKFHLLVLVCQLSLKKKPAATVFESMSAVSSVSVVINTKTYKYKEVLCSSHLIGLWIKTYKTCQSTKCFNHPCLYFLQVDSKWER